MFGIHDKKYDAHIIFRHDIDSSIAIALLEWYQCKQEKDEVRAQLELVEMLVECGTRLLEAEQVQVHYPIHQKHPQAGLG